MLWASQNKTVIQVYLETLFHQVTFLLKASSGG